MNIEDVINNRRTIHDYKDETIDLEVVKTALELGLMSPNHKLTFPWKFILANKKTLIKLSEVAVDIKSKKDKLSDVKVKFIISKFTTPSYMVALCLKKSANDFQEREDYATIACSVQNISLYLWQQGVGTKWSTGGVTSDAETYKVLGVNSAEYEIVGFLWIGVPLRIPKAPERPKLMSVLTILD